MDNKDVNEKNAKEFEDLMEKSSTNVDKFYYDSKNPFVVIILIVLALVIVAGCFYLFS